MIADGAAWQLWLNEARTSALDVEDFDGEFDLRIERDDYVRCEVRGYRGRPDRGEVCPHEPDLLGELIIRNQPSSSGLRCEAVRGR